MSHNGSITFSAIVFVWGDIYCFSWGPGDTIKKNITIVILLNNNEFHYKNYLPIDYALMNLSSDSLKIKCKQLFLT